jgi:tRNA(fMet)-specific endonuclease VapC
VKYLFDTDHLSIYQRQTGPEFAALSARIALHSPADFALSIISLHEQALGCHAYIQRAHSDAEVLRGYAMLARALQDFSTSPVLPFDAPAMAIFSTLVQQRIRVPTMDLRIASVALANKLILLTRNAKDFRKVPGLVIDDWTI